MNTLFKKQRTTLRNQSGFTLIEMLIVVIVLGILAMIIIPQISVSTDDAKLSTLQTNLGSLRSAVELYYHQHDSKYPGPRKPTDPPNCNCCRGGQRHLLPSLQNIRRLAVKQPDVKAAPAIYGPYLKGITLPTNPFNNLNDRGTVILRR